LCFQQFDRFRCAAFPNPSVRSSVLPLTRINAKRLRVVPPFVVAVRRPYEAALIDVDVTDRNDPITELIAKSIVNVTASGERDPKEAMDAHFRRSAA
jgi:hypothetical protein